ncbi:MAG: IS3 family transposase [Candidatus Methanospirareceae archaeon]
MSSRFHGCITVFSCIYYSTGVSHSRWSYFRGAGHRSRQEAVEGITEYLEIFYNRQRLQAGLVYLSPAAYAQKYYGGLLAA